MRSHPQQIGRHRLRTRRGLHGDCHDRVYLTGRGSCFCWSLYGCCCEHNLALTCTSQVSYKSLHRRRSRFGAIIRYPHRSHGRDIDRRRVGLLHGGRRHIGRWDGTSHPCSRYDAVWSIVRSNMLVLILLATQRRRQWCGWQGGCGRGCGKQSEMFVICSRSFKSTSAAGRSGRGSFSEIRSDGPSYTPFLYGFL